VHPLLAPYLVDQAGTVSRRQAFKAGLHQHDLDRMLRRRELVRLHPGVYLDHTGRPTWLQTAWAAVLLCGPGAALAGQSALRAFEGTGTTRRTTPIELVVAANRHPQAQQGIEVTRSRHLEQRVQWHLGPPRLRYDEAVLDVAAEAVDELGVVDELSRAVQGRRTTAKRLLAALEGRQRLTRSGWIAAVLADVAEGVCSVLEHAYLTKVERAHGLSRARRQVRDRVGAGTIYRDVEYDGGLVIELDGRLFHDTASQRDRDLDRDLVAATAGKDTVRLGYGQVFDRPCWTAGHLAVLQRRHGSPGTSRRCGPNCAIGVA
jgi:hypothetical protein